MLGISARASVVLGLFGFVFHMVFGKGYKLIPSYFERQLSPSWIPIVQFPLTVSGTLVSAYAHERPAEVTTLVDVTALGATLWFVGVVTFVGGIGWTIKDNLAARETATGAHNTDRRLIDRMSNLFMPVALAYLLAGSYQLLASETGLEPLVSVYFPRTLHLLGVGTATLLVFAIGFRMFPRFLNTSSPTVLVTTVLVTGAIGPAGLAWTVPTGDLMWVFATAQVIAVVGYAATMGMLFLKADTPRVGMYGVLLGACFGIAGVALGAWFTLDGVTAARIEAHGRATILGFLGLTIVGTAYQFHPPNASRYPAGNDRTALVSLAALASGVAVEIFGLLTESSLLVSTGQFTVTLGALLVAYLVLGVLTTAP